MLKCLKDLSISSNVCQGDKSSLKGLFDHFSFGTTKIARNSRWSQKGFQITNPDYDRVIKRFHLYYDLRLITFGIDEERNLIVQFPVFVQPYTQQQLILYQIEIVPVPIIDQNKQVHSYTHLQIDRPYIALNSETYISLRQHELRTCKKIGYEFYHEELFVVKYKSKYSCESTKHFDLGSDIIKIVILYITLIKLIWLTILVAEMKLFWQIGQMIKTLYAI